MRLRTFVTAFILFFWGTMMFLQVRYEYVSTGKETPEPSFTRQEFSEYLTREDQVDYLIQDEEHRRIGDMQRKVVRRKPEIVIEQTINLTLSELTGSAGEQGDLTIHKTATFEQSGNIRSFRMRFQLSDDRLQTFLSTLFQDGELVVSGERREGNLHVWFGKENGNTFQLGKTLQVSSSFNPMGDLRPPAPGKSRVSKVMDPLENGTMEVRISTSPASRTLLWQDQEIQAHQVTIRAKQESQEGIDGTAWITSSGAVLRQRITHPLIPFDLRFLRITPLPESDRG